MPGPLDGYRVIDLTSMVSGPFATMMLGDQGADVIKVESLGQGDHTRTGSNRSNGLASGFLNVNRNKRSLAIDLKDERGRDAVLRSTETELLAGIDFERKLYAICMATEDSREALKAYAEKRAPRYKGR